MAMPPRSDEDLRPHGSDPSVRNQKPASDRAHRLDRDCSHQLSAVHVDRPQPHPPADAWRHKVARPGARPAAGGRRNVLRVRRDDAAKYGRTGRHEILSVGVSIFMFILVLNLIGIIPYAFTVT